MNNSITLSDLIQLISWELSHALDHAVDPSDLFATYMGKANGLTFEDLPKLRVSDIELDLPAHIRLQAASSASSNPQLMLTLPSLLETPLPSRLGRIRITIKAEQEPLSDRCCE